MTHAIYLTPKLVIDILAKAMNLTLWSQQNGKLISNFYLFISISILPQQNLFFSLWYNFFWRIVNIFPIDSPNVDKALFTEGSCTRQSTAYIDNFGINVDQAKFSLFEEIVIVRSTGIWRSLKSASKYPVSVGKSNSKQSSTSNVFYFFLLLQK